MSNTLKPLAPAKIILLRHGEKANPFELCCTGVHRSVALADQYLGKGASPSLFKNGEEPAAFFAITLHTIETASPAAQSWSLPVTVFGAVPILGSKFGECDAELDNRTTQAVDDLRDQKWSGKTIVMIWEHKRIANPGQPVSLYDLLGLSAPALNVPSKWPGENYDFLWEITFTAGVPTMFVCTKQKYAAPYEGLPHNDWGKPATLPADCET
jgi:hypothetical protein